MKSCTLERGTSVSSDRFSGSNEGKVLLLCICKGLHLLRGVVSGFEVCHGSESVFPCLSAHDKRYIGCAVSVVVLVNIWTIGIFLTAKIFRRCCFSGL